MTLYRLFTGLDVEGDNEHTRFFFNRRHTERGGGEGTTVGTHACVVD